MGAMGEDDMEILSDADPMDEILHHTSEQTLRLAHIDEGVSELKTSLEDMGEAVTTGMVELRGLVAQNAHQQAAPAPASGSDDLHRQVLLERLDDLERRVSRSTGMLSLLLFLLAAQMAGLGVVAWLGQKTLQTAKSEILGAKNPTAEIPIEASPTTPPSKMANDERKAELGKVDPGLSKKKRRR